MVQYDFNVDCIFHVTCCLKKNWFCQITHNICLLFRCQKSNLCHTRESRYYAEACYQWRHPSPRFSVWAAQLKTSQQWWAVSHTVTDLTCLGIKPQICINSNMFNNELICEFRFDAMRLSTIVPAYRFSSKEQSHLFTEQWQLTRLSLSSFMLSVTGLYLSSSVFVCLFVESYRWFVFSVNNVSPYSISTMLAANILHMQWMFFDW